MAGFKRSFGHRVQGSLGCAWIIDLSREVMSFEQLGFQSLKKGQTKSRRVSPTSGV